jgi:hypothetical protein
VITTKRAALAAALLVPVLTGLGACSASVSAGSDSGYDADAVAKQLQKAQAEASPDYEVSDATCPADADPEEGDSIECTVSVAGVESPYTVTFTEVTSDGTKFDIIATHAIVSVEETVASIRAQLDKQGFTDVDVDCGDAAVVIQEPDTTFTCTLTEGTDTFDATVTIKDLEGNIHFKA